MRSKDHFIMVFAPHFLVCSSFSLKGSHRMTWIL
nr:MAG TPA: hypothetical protein [Caudoviricetes sp.]